MSTFLMLSTVGPDGAATLAENPDRLKAVNAEVESMGVRVLAQWALLGPYDFCTVLDAPDEKTMARVALVLGSDHLLFGKFLLLRKGKRNYALVRFEE